MADAETGLRRCAYAPSSSVIRAWNTPAWAPYAADDAPARPAPAAVRVTA